MGLCDGVMALETETATYVRELPKLAEHEGKFVVIQGDKVIGIFVSYEDALQVGYEKCGLVPFMVKRIQTMEQIQFFSRDVCFEPCPT